MMIFGMCVLVYPQVRNARLADPEMDVSNIELVLLLGGVFQTVFGTFSLVVGFLVTVHDYGSLLLTRVLIAVTQLAWIPFVTGALMSPKDVALTVVCLPSIPLLFLSFCHRACISRSTDESRTRQWIYPSKLRSHSSRRKICRRHGISGHCSLVCWSLWVALFHPIHALCLSVWQSRITQ